MKTLMLSLAIAVCTVLHVNAQTSGSLKNSTPEQRAEKMTEWMKTNLQLSDDQASAVHAINLKYANENESLKDSGSARRDKYRKAKETQESKEQELKGALTADQFSTYMDKKKELQQKMREEVRERKN